MALNEGATQFELQYRPTRLGNWEVPKPAGPRPRPRSGCTQFVADSRGHLLESSYKSVRSPWISFRRCSTWTQPPGPVLFRSDCKSRSQKSQCVVSARSEKNAPIDVVPECQQIKCPNVEVDDEDNRNTQDARKKRSNRSSEPCAKNTADEVPTPEQNNLDSLSVKSTQSPDSAKIIDTNIPSVETYEDLLTRKYKLLSIQNDKDSAKSVLKFRKDLQEQVSNSRRHLRMQAQDLMKRNRAHWPIADFHTADVRRIYGRPIVYKANLHPRPTECTKNVVTLPRQLTPDNATAAATTRPTTPPPQPRAPPRRPTQMEMAIYWDISSEDKQQLSQMGHSVGQITYKNTDTSMEPKSKTEVVEQKPVEIPKETRSSIDDQEHDQHNTSVSNTESNHNGDSGSDRKVVDIEEKKLLQLDCSSNKSGTNPSLSASNESSVGDSNLVASIVAGRPIAIPDSPQNSTINTERTNTSRIVREYDRSSPNDRQTEISRKVVTHVNCRNNDKQVSRGSKPVESEILKQQRPHTTGHRCFTQKPAKWQQSESEEMKRTAHQRRCLCLNRLRRPTSTPLEGYRSRLGKLRSAPMRHRSGQERWRFVTTYALTNSFVHKPRRFRSLQRALYH